MSRILTETDQNRARRIMGANFFGTDEAVEHFGLNPTKRELASLGRVPFPGTVLQKCRDTHVLVAVFPFSILEIREKIGHKSFYHPPRTIGSEFAKTRHGKATWHLVCKTPVPRSTSKSWSDQQALVDKKDEVPVARVIVYVIIGYFLATGKRLFNDVYVRTSCVDSGNNRVSVGGFGFYGGLYVGAFWGDGHSPYLGVSSARKL